MHFLPVQIKHRSNGLLSSPSRRGALAGAVTQAMGLPAREQQRLADAGRTTALRWGAQGAVHGVVQALEALLHLGLPYSHSTPLSELGEAWSGAGCGAQGTSCRSNAGRPVAAPTEPLTEIGTLPVRAAGVPAAVGSRDVGVREPERQGLSVPGSLARALGLRVSSKRPCPAWLRLPRRVNSLALYRAAESRLPLPPTRLLPPMHPPPPPLPMRPHPQPLPLSSLHLPCPPSRQHPPSPSPRHTPGPPPRHAGPAAEPSGRGRGGAEGAPDAGGGCVVEELEQQWRREAMGSTPEGPTGTEGTEGALGVRGPQ